MCFCFIRQLHKTDAHKKNGQERSGDTWQRLLWGFNYVMLSHKSTLCPLVSRACRTPLVWINLEVIRHFEIHSTSLPVHNTDVFPQSVFQLKSIFISSCVRYVYKDITYNSLYMLPLPISSLRTVGQTIDEPLQAVKLKRTPSTGEGLLLQRKTTHPRSSSICHICELNHHEAQFQKNNPKLVCESSRQGIMGCYAHSSCCANRAGRSPLDLKGFPVWKIP